MDTRNITGLLFVLACVLVYARGNVNRAAREQRVLDNIFKDNKSEKHVRPPSTSRRDDAVKVTVGFHLYAVNMVSPKGYMDLTGQLVMRWQDKRLTWTSSMRRGEEVSAVRVPPEHIWTPDVELSNGVYPGMRFMNKHPLAVIHSNGEVNLIYHAATRSQCDVIPQMTRPSVNCTLKFATWAYNDNAVAVKMQEYEHDSEIMSDYIPSGRWQARRVNVRMMSKKYACCPNDPYSTVAFDVTLVKTKPRNRG